MIIDFSQRKIRSKLIISPKKKFQSNNPFIHSQIYSLSSPRQWRKKVTSSNQAIRPVESSSSARRGPSTRRSEGEGRKEGIVGVLLARSVPVGFTPPPPVRPNWKSGKRGSVKAARFWATPDPFNELVIAFWAGHPSPLPTGAVATGLVFCFCRPRSTIPSPSISERLGPGGTTTPERRPSRGRGRKSASGSAVDDDYYICESPVGSSV